MITPKKTKTALVALVGIATLFYSTAIIVRQYIVPFYANTFYKKSVEKEFATSFSDINKELDSLGLTQYRSSGFDPSAKSATCYNHVTDNGQNGYYEGFSETVPCIKQLSLDPLVPDDEFIAAWRADSHKLLEALNSNEWKITRNFVAGTDLPTDIQNQQPIAKIFDVPNRSPADQDASEITFSKTNGKIKCYFSISYANDGPSPVKSIWLNEGCERNVSFFGGSSG